jgi:two-component system, cell cycle response regulator
MVTTVLERGTPGVGRPPAWALRAAQIAAVAGLAAFLVHSLTGAGDAGLAALFHDWVYNALLVLAAAACLARALAIRTERTAWLLLALGIAAWTAGDLHYTIAYSGGREPPFPSPGDALYLAFYPASYGALVLLFRSRMSRFVRSLWLDGVTAALASAAVGTSVLLALVVATTDGSSAAIATNLAYPLGDVVLLALVIGVFASTGWRPGAGWTFLGAGLVAAAIADAIYLSRVATGTYVEGGAADVLWPAAMLLLAQAAWRPREDRPRPVSLEGRRVLLTPAVCGLIGVAVLTYDHFERTNPLALGLSIATVLAVLLRLDVTFAEKRRLLGRLRQQATTDPVTGLGNRRKLLADLGGLLPPSGNRIALLMIFDLDGFKTYNDTFGHPAGDALLSRLGGRLAAAVRPHGDVYRLGGDEFCLLAPLQDVEAEALIETAASALREHGDGFEVDSSFGAVFLPDETSEPAEALRLADQRLYAEKARKLSGRGDPHDLLLRVLFEREPDLHDHVRSVAGLAEATGRALGLRGPALEELRRAAELHDIGKLAVPDEILRKALPLEDDEWEFMRRHTLIGQRILRASPALVNVGTIVRSTHERWDGGGYPDGLHGQEIPLAARIIFACDSFVAMTAGRPYTPPATADGARQELRRCAGAQFDPAVVEAVCVATRALLAAAE